MLLERWEFNMNDENKYYDPGKTQCECTNCKYYYICDKYYYELEENLIASYIPNCFEEDEEET